MRNGERNTKNSYEKKRVLHGRTGKISRRQDAFIRISKVLYRRISCINVFGSFSNVFSFKLSQLLFFMKINAVRVLIIASLLIIILYTLGLFLPIIKNTKDSKIDSILKTKIVIFL